MRNLEKKDYILIGIFALLVLVLFILLNNRNKESDIRDSINYNLVNNLSTFFTLEGTANRYIKVLYSKDSDNLMRLIDSEYINNNSITKDNIIKKLDNLDGIYSFKAKKMYYEKIDDNHTKYYLSGLLQKDIINEYDYGVPYYLIITIEHNDYIFSVTPYNGEIFKEEA